MVDVGFVGFVGAGEADGFEQATEFQALLARKDRMGEALYIREGFFADGDSPRRSFSQSGSADKDNNGDDLVMGEVEAVGEGSGVFIVLTERVLK